MENNAGLPGRQMIAVLRTLLALSLHGEGKSSSLPNNEHFPSSSYVWNNMAQFKIFNSYKTDKLSCAEHILKYYNT